MFPLDNNTPPLHIYYINQNETFAHFGILPYRISIDGTNMV